MIVTILRKPLEGTVAGNTLKHGCGGLNIDATRINTSNSLNGGAYAREPHERHDGKENWRFERGRAGEYEQPSGRWPANVILKHKQGCELKGTKKIKEGKKNNDLGGTERETGLYEDGLKERAKDQHQGEEMVEDWICVKGCPVQELDQQSGKSKSTGGRIGNAQGVYSNLGASGFKNNSTKGNPGYGDVGGASRFFKQIHDWSCVEGCPVQELDRQSGVLRSRGNIGASKGGGGMFGHGSVLNNFGAGDEGGASRFFKQFKKDNEK